MCKMMVSFVGKTGDSFGGYILKLACPLAKRQVHLETLLVFGQQLCLVINS